MKKLLSYLTTEWVVLIAITVVAVVVRFWHLDTLPAALNRDEAALGYNAWMLQTLGKDEWGTSWPLALKSFGDYKLPGYPLLTILSFQLFGRSDWSVRFPSALAGSLLPLVVWYLTKQLRWNTYLRISASAVVALAPFTIFYSRMAFEANVALTLMTWTLGLLLNALNTDSPKKIWLPLIIWLVAIFTYNTPLLLTPFLIGGVVVGYWRTPKATGRWIAIGLLLVFSSAVAALWQLNRHKAGISIFTDPTIETRIVERYTSTTGLEHLLASRYVVYAQLLTQHFLNSWSVPFLVTHGGSHPWHTVPGTGHLTWFIYIFGCWGIFITILRTGVQLYKRSFTLSQKNEVLLLWVAMTSLAPSIVTVDSPHATRSLLFLLLLTIFSITGATHLFQLTKRFQPQLQRLGVIGLMSFATVTAGAYLIHYFFQYPQQQAVFQPGLATVLKQTAASNKPVIVAGDGYTYISIAWYLPVTPQHFLDTITRHSADTIGFEPGRSVDRFTIRPDFKTPEATQATLVEWTSEGWQIHTE